MRLERLCRKRTGRATSKALSALRVAPGLVSVVFEAVLDVTAPCVWSRGIRCCRAVRRGSYSCFVQENDVTQTVISSGEVSPFQLRIHFNTSVTVTSLDEVQSLMSSLKTKAICCVLNVFLISTLKPLPLALGVITCNHSS